MISMRRIVCAKQLGFHDTRPTAARTSRMPHPQPAIHRTACPSPTLPLPVPASTRTAATSFVPQSAPASRRPGRPSRRRPPAPTTPAAHRARSRSRWATPIGPPAAPCGPNAWPLSARCRLSGSTPGCSACANTWPMWHRVAPGWVILRSRPNGFAPVRCAVARRDRRAGRRAGRRGRRHVACRAGRG